MLSSVSENRAQFGHTLSCDKVKGRSILFRYNPIVLGDN